MMSDDLEHLREFVKSGAESAFREIVRRHAPMVQGVASRRTGDRALAEEVTQTVFAILARKAASITHQELAGWLHRAAFIESRNAWRKEHRHRRALERMTTAMSDDEREAAPPEASWQEIRPHLDELIGQLSVTDRQLVVMRYFEQLSYREIGQTTGRSEPASRKQMERALDRLGQLLRKRGVAAPGTALATVLAAQALCTPSASAAVISAAALQAAPALAGTATLTHTLVLMTSQTVVKTSAVMLILAAVPIGLLTRRNHDLQAEIGRYRGTSPALGNDEGMTANNATGSRGNNSTRRDRPTAAVRLVRSSFRPGQSAEWITAIDRGLATNSSEVLALFQLMQELSTLSEADTLEICDQASKMLDLYNRGDAEMRAEFNGNSTFESVLGLAIYHLAQMDPEKALAALEGMKGTGKRDEIERAVYAALAKKDLPATLERLKGLDAKSDENAFEGIVSVLAVNDPQAALDMVQKRSGGEYNKDWIKLIMRISAHDSQFAIDKTLEAVGKGANPDVLGAAINHASTESRQAVLAWAMSYTGENAGAVKAFAIGNTSGRDMDAALNLWAKEQASLSPRERGRAAEEIATNLTGQDPARAVQWISNLPANAAGEMALRRAFSRWAEVDIPAAAAWAEQQPQGPMREQVLEDFAERSSDKSPEKALHAASLLRDEEKRAKAMGQVLEQWEKKDPAAAGEARKKYQ